MHIDRIMCSNTSMLGHTNSKLVKNRQKLQSYTRQKHGCHVWHAQWAGYCHFIFQTFRISCGEWVEQVRSLRNGIRAIWKFDKSCTGPPNGSEFKLHFRALCTTYGVKRKPTSIKNPQANSILEHIHAVFTNMLRTAELDTAELVNASGIDIFLADAAWAPFALPYSIKSLTRCSNIWTRLLFDIPFIAD
jgi:hypothetical protein